MEYLYGFIVGILGSFIFWLVITKLFVPKIEFSKEISKELNTDDNDPVTYKYKFKFYNRGFRDIIDMEIFVIFKIKGLKKNKPKIWDVFHIPLFHSRIPYLEKKKNKIFTFQLSKSTDFDVAYIPDNIKEKIKDHSIELEDLFSLGTNATMQIFIYGYDEFSGSRKLFKSSIFRNSDIKEGVFILKGLTVKKLPVG